MINLHCLTIASDIFLSSLPENLVSELLAKDGKPQQKVELHKKKCSYIRQCKTMTTPQPKSTPAHNKKNRLTIMTFDDYISASQGKAEFGAPMMLSDVLC